MQIALTVVAIILGLYSIVATWVAVLLYFETKCRDEAISDWQRRAVHADNNNLILRDRLEAARKALEGK